eukprot:1576820-Lingulodinium_polyedra.AAC.1
MWTVSLRSSVAEYGHERVRSAGRGLRAVARIQLSRRWDASAVPAATTVVPAVKPPTQKDGARLGVRGNVR